MSDKITLQQFKKAFLERVYFQEFSAAMREGEKELQRRFDEAVQGRIPTDLVIRFKRYSSVIPVRLKIETPRPFMLTVTPDLQATFPDKPINAKNQQPMLSIYSNSIPSVEQMMKRLPSSMTMLNQNWKLFVCEQNEATLKRVHEILSTFAEESKRILEQIRDEVIEKFEVSFNESTGFTVLQLASLFFNYEPGRYRDFLVNNGFTDVPTLDKFPTKSSEDSTNYPSCYPMSGWELSRKPDGYGHECGSAVDVYWSKKTCYTFGWSSDD